MQFDILPKDVKNSKIEFNELKKENTTKLNALKNLNFKLRDKKITFNEFINQQSSIVDEYRKINTKKNYKAKEHNALLESKKVFGFDNIQFFFGEFGWALGLLLYSLSNLIFTFIKSQLRNIGELIKHSVFIYIGGFYAYYPFLYKSDYSRMLYSLSLIVCTLVTIVSIYLINRYFRKNSKLAILVNWVLEIRRNHYQKMAIRALDNAEYYCQTIEDIEDFEKETKRQLSKIVE